MGNGAALNGTVGLLRWEPWLDRLRLMAGSEDEDEDEDEDLVVSSCDLDRFDMVVTWGELERIKMKKVGKLGREVSVGLWECVFSRCVRGHLKPPRRRLGCLWL